MYHRLSEIWIADQPIILITHVAKYLPLIMRPLAVRLVGPIRLKMLQAGELGYDMMVRQLRSVFCCLCHCSDVIDQLGVMCFVRFITEKLWAEEVRIP